MKNRTYTALITDLDGTAVSIASDGSDIKDETKSAVRLAIKNGKKIACATGREWVFAKPIIQELGLTSPCIVEGGTRIINPITDEIIWEKSLQQDASAEILAVFKSVPTSGFIVHSANIDRQQIATIDSLPQSLRFLYLLEVEKEAAATIVDGINASNFAVAHLTPSWYKKDAVDIHVTHPQGTKGHAVHAWQAIENITVNETIGMGDSGNDIPIFQSAGCKIAVASATPDLKELADHIAPSPEEQALKYVIDSFLLTS